MGVVERVTATNRIRNLFLNPLLGPGEAANLSKNFVSSWSPSLFQKLRRCLGRYTPWQLIVIFAFAFSTITLFRALAGVGYIQHDASQYQYGGSPNRVAHSSGKGYPNQRGAHAAFSSLSILGSFRRIAKIVGPKKADNIPDELEFGTPLPTTIQQHAHHRMRAGAAWKKSRPRRIGSDMHDKLEASEGAEYASISHNNLHGRVFAEHGGEPTDKYAVDTQSYEHEDSTRFRTG
jgi:hypothetical protein